jgi:hypothetical protein
MTQIFAPWSDEQVATLNRWQKLGYVHEFTCPGDGCKVRVLTARKSGWVCEGCGYQQTWAHDFMLGPASRPPKVE